MNAAQIHSRYRDSTYCYEYEQLIRAEIEAERVQVEARDEPTARELAEAAQPA